MRLSKLTLLPKHCDSFLGLVRYITHILFIARGQAVSCYSYAWYSQIQARLHTTTALMPFNCCHLCNRLSAEMRKVISTTCRRRAYLHWLSLQSTAMRKLLLQEVAVNSRCNREVHRLCCNWRTDCITALGRLLLIVRQCKRVALNSTVIMGAGRYYIGEVVAASQRF
jgi:hypothetical protein